MKDKIIDIIKNFKGTVGVSIKDSNNNKISINENEIFPSASIIKLFILMSLPKGDYNKRIEILDSKKVEGCGILKVLDTGLNLTVKDLAYLMICLSDNTATNLLIDHIGFENINSFIKDHGFTNTILSRKMMDTESKKLGKDNFTTPKETLKILEMVCNDFDTLNMIKNQAYKSKIPLYFPRETNFSHKTGELENIEHDAGRLFLEKGWVDIVIFTKDLEKNEDGIKINSLIGKEIFDYYLNFF